MAKEDDWEQLWAHTESAFGGKVTLLVNNAGVNPKVEGHFNPGLFNPKLQHRTINPPNFQP